MSKRHQLIESARLAKGEVDRELGIIKGVKVLGEESANGKVYRRAVRERAHRLMEGKVVNIDHHAERPKPGQKVKRPNVPWSARFGVLQNVHERDDGTYADLKYLKEHREANTICEAAETMPHILGMSILGEGPCHEEGGKLIVDAIDILDSVDIVTDGATVQGLFESAGDEEPGHEEAMSEGLCAAIVGVFKDSSLSTEEKLKKIKHIVKFDEKMKPAPAEGEGEQTEEECMKESTDLTVEQLRDERDVRLLIESNSMVSSPELVTELLELPGEDRQAAIDLAKKRRALRKPGKRPDQSQQMREDRATPVVETPEQEDARLDRFASLLRS